MNANNQTPEDRKKTGLLKKIWLIASKPTSKYSLGTLIVVGGALGILFWGGFNWALEITNTEAFCISCHEMRDNVYKEYKGSVHDVNASGVRATCPDCHVPKEWTYKIVRKIQASNELYHKILGTIDTREKYEAKRIKLAVSEWTRMKKANSRECKNCHSFDGMDVALQEKRARKRHLVAIDENKTCIDCHKGIAHELPEGAIEAEKLFNAKWDAESSK